MKVLFNGYGNHFQVKNKYFDFAPMVVDPAYSGFNKIHLIVIYDKAKTYSRGNANKVASELIKQTIQDPKIIFSERKVKDKFFALFEFYSESSYAKFVEEEKFNDAKRIFKQILSDLEWRSNDYYFYYKHRVDSILNSYPKLLTDEACVKLAVVDNEFKQRIVDGKYKYVIFPSESQRAKLMKKFTGTSIAFSIIKYENGSSGFWRSSLVVYPSKYAMLLTTTKKSDLAFIKMAEGAWEE